MKVRLLRPSKALISYEIILTLGDMSAILAQNYSLDELRQREEMRKGDTINRCLEL